MTRSQTVWTILWQRAAQADGPFEVDEVAPAVAKALNLTETEAGRKIIGLLGELERLPEGEQFFRLEGNAVVPLPEFRASAKSEPFALQAYPFET